MKARLLERQASTRGGQKSQIDAGAEVVVLEGSANVGYTICAASDAENVATQVPRQSLQCLPATAAMPAPSTLVDRAREDAARTSSSQPLATTVAKCPQSAESSSRQQPQQPASSSVYRFHVLVLDDDQEATLKKLDSCPINGASCQAFGNPATWNGSTDDKGRATTSLPAGLYKATAEKPDDYLPFDAANWNVAVKLESDMPEDSPVVRKLMPRLRAIEVGAGGGDFSAGCKQEFGAVKYYATDVSGSSAKMFGTNKKFLHEIPDGCGELRKIFGVDANAIVATFAGGCADVIIGINNYGAGRNNPGTSYGLSRHPYKNRNPKEKSSTGYSGMCPDFRFVQSARIVLKESGRCVLRCKSNILVESANKLLQSGKMSEDDCLAARKALNSHNMRLGYPSDDGGKLVEVNQYSRTTLSDLHHICMQYSYTVLVRTASSAIVGRAADSSISLTQEQRKTELGSYNTEFVFSSCPLALPASPVTLVYPAPFDREVQYP